jgi:hypothetical protein
LKLGNETLIREAIAVMNDITERDIKRHVNEAVGNEAGQAIQPGNHEKR